MRLKNADVGRTHYAGPVSPLFRKGEREDPLDLRPITVTPMVYLGVGCPSDTAVHGLARGMDTQGSTRRTGNAFDNGRFDPNILGT